MNSASHNALIIILTQLNRDRSQRPISYQRKLMDDIQGDIRKANKIGIKLDVESK